MASSVRRELHCRLKTFRGADGGNDDRIDEGFRDVPLVGRRIDGASRKLRKLKQFSVRGNLKRSRKVSVAFRSTQVRTSFHLGGHPTARRSPPTTRTGWCSHARG